MRIRTRIRRIAAALAPWCYTCHQWHTGPCPGVFGGTTA